MTIRPATPDDFDDIRTMLREYQEWLQVDLCFQNFEEELARLPGEYAPPRGQFLLAPHALSVLQARGAIITRLALPMTSACF